MFECIHFEERVEAVAEILKYYKCVTTSMKPKVTIRVHEWIDSITNILWESLRASKKGQVWNIEDVY